MTPDDAKKVIADYEQLRDRLAAELRDWKVLTERFIEVQRQLEQGQDALLDALADATRVHRGWAEWLELHGHGSPREWWQDDSHDSSADRPDPG